MASEEPVTQPLRISKSTPNTSPSKSSLPRPLSEIPVTEKRRNSPSWSQQQKTQKPSLNTDSSPFQSSPLDSAASPRLFWQNRHVNKAENADLYSGLGGSPSPTRRASVERLQKASRVKNSTMFAREQKQEYDPARLPTVERPLAKVQGNAFRPGHARSESQTSVPLYSPTKTPSTPTGFGARSPSKDQISPTKSSLSSNRFKSSFNSQISDLSADETFEERQLPFGKSLHRHAKSVTFDAAPPQINEYEMATPDLSSVGSNSREGSFESDEDEFDDYGPYPGDDSELQEDSFDATLEDTAKTPVVGPDDWRQDRDQRFDSSPMPESAPARAAAARPSQVRTDSCTSSGEHRPLPPLPGASHSRTSSTGTSATAERMLSSSRHLPSPPAASSTSKLEIQNIGNGKMTLEERLKLMMLSDETSPKAADHDQAAKTAAEQQRERRMRRAGARDRVGSPTPERDMAMPNLEAAQEASEQVLAEVEAAMKEPETKSETQTEPEAEAAIEPEASRDTADNNDAGHDVGDDTDAAEGDDTIGDISGFGLDYQLPNISRESIMNRVNGNKTLDRESDYTFMSPGPGSSPARQTPAPYDPDVPMPSIEHSVIIEETQEFEDSVIIHRDQAEDEDEDIGDHDDVYDLYQRSEDEESIAQTDDLTDESESHYSEYETKSDFGPDEDSASTPRAASPADDKKEEPNFNATLPLPGGSPVKENDFTRSFQTYMLPKPKETDAMIHAETRKKSDTQRPSTPDQPVSKPEYDGSGWGEPEDDEPGTPDSVIHHPVSDDEEEETFLDELDEPIESPAVPEQMATIKSASGSRLKTRPSATPSDIASMRDARRHISREVVPDIPPIPDRHRGRLSRDLQIENVDDEVVTDDEILARNPSFKKRSLTLDLDLNLNLDQDFDRVIEAQKVAFPLLYPHSHAPGPGHYPPRQASGKKTSATPELPTDFHNRGIASHANITTRTQRGYLMRQNTKLVAASDRPSNGDRESGEFRPGSRSVGNSPVKQQRPQSWTVEPWNPNARRSVKKRHPTGMGGGAVPPMPGQEGNTTSMNTVPEDEAPELATDECGERGRLFVKVMGVKDLDLPLPRNERTWFSLTLDNGVHCVTTAWLELARNAPIGQEFELVVPNDLEFQLTLNVKLERPEPQRLATASPTKMAKPKASTFSRVFASPKKRKEMEARARAEEEAQAMAQREAASRQKKVAPTGWDLLSPLTAEDGSFARSYVCLKEHESRCYGRPYMAEITAFNEWAAEEASFASSVKSKRADTSNSVVRRAPYKVGKLEVQLLFVPRPKGSTDEDMPKSMNSCIRELKAAEERLSRNWEGHLSQQGGDCPYWRRRYFKLVGTKLTAYHETTRQPRATINLSNTRRLIDDRRQLTNPETTGRGGKRRRSAFAEEEEGYMFVEEGFRIRFNNGEVIDFYADTPEDKEGWMRVLSDVIGRGNDDDDASGPGGNRRKWCDLVLKREEALRKRAEGRKSHEGRRSHSKTKSMIF